jgi:wyosine [tRNA(Phe)-imidazoG37] synthetase (radical SAM superfamily)
MEHIFGPVLSRRLGFSLGVDIVPFKTCSLDCVYCQVGETTDKTMERREYISLNSVISEIKNSLTQHQKIDYITLSGSGEPTLNIQLGEIITAVKGITDIPVAVITNGTLLHFESVREELLAADLVLPSLDAVSQEVFCKTNRPHKSLEVSEMISGLKSFREVFSGEIWLEIMLVSGLNDTPGEIEKIKSVVSSIECDKIQLNTTVRPVADKVIEPLGREELERIKNLLGPRCEVIAEFKEDQHTVKNNISGRILDIIKRRPLNLYEISDSLGIPEERATKYISLLKEQDKIESLTYGSESYYQLKR